MIDSKATEPILPEYVLRVEASLLGYGYQVEIDENNIS